MQNITLKGLLLENSSLIEIEEKITQFYNCKVLYSNEEMVIGIIQEDIEKSGYKIEDLKIFIENYKNIIIDFGILLLQNDKPKEGIYFGFSILYATYLKLLIVDDKKKLLQFLKLLRIPKIKLFSDQLFEIKAKLKI